MKALARDMSFNSHVGKPKPPISYEEALSKIEQVVKSFEVNHRTSSSAPTHQNTICIADGVCEAGPLVPLVEAVGSRSYYTLYAPYSTPQYDTSAMDGFAVNAKSTNDASPDSPVKLRVIDSIAAGDKPFRGTSSALDNDNLQSSCAEIMTGACFPESLPYLDSVVKIEDVNIEQTNSTDGKNLFQHIVLEKPVKQFQNRRPAGSDFQQGDVIIKHSISIEPKHVAALASLGYTHIRTGDVRVPNTEPIGARCTVSVGILSTGTEIVETNRISGSSKETSTQQRIQDSNGPYLVSGLRSACPWVHVEYLGVVNDDEGQLTETLREAIFERSFDIVLTSGGVSKGRHDLVRHVVEDNLGGDVVFHGVDVRPGAPILFASFNEPKGVKGRHVQTAFFGAPGNPLATAVALKFFVIPFVMNLHTKQANKRWSSTLSECRTENTTNLPCGPKQDKKIWAQVNSMRQTLSDKTMFRLAKRHDDHEDEIEIVKDQASYKLRGLLEANCWVIIPASLNKSSCEVAYLSNPL